MGEAIADAREYTPAELEEEEELENLFGPAIVYTQAEFEEKIKADWLREKERELRDIKELAKELGHSKLAKELAELEDTLPYLAEEHVAQRGARRARLLDRDRVSSIN